MKILISVIFGIFSFSYLKVSAQSLDDALEKAKKEKKIVMVLVTSEKCTQCNDVAEQGLSTEVAQRAINASCILVKQPKLPEEFSNPYVVYSFPESFFGAIYLDADKNILRVYNGSASFYKTYLDNLEAALKEQNRPDKLNTLVNDYYLKKNQFAITEALVKKIASLGLESKEILLDDLTQNAPVDSAASLSFLQFVLKSAPLVASTAQGFVEKNRDNYNMAWYRMPLQERSAINNRIYHKSLAKAVEDKDIAYIYRLAAFRQSNFQAEPNRVRQVFPQVLLQYYKGINDSTQYLNNVKSFYDTYFMTINADSIQRIDSINKAKIFNGRPLINPPGGGAIAVEANGKIIRFTPQALYYASNLNDGAWTVYTYTNKPYFLNKALLWSKRAIEFSPTAEIMDTYARLLYKTNYKEAAIEWETKAIEQNKVRKISSAVYDKVLDAMKKGLEKIDEY